MHPRHRKQASDIEKTRGQRFQAVATDTDGITGRHDYPRIDVLHRNHAGVEDVIRTAKDLGLRRMPSYYLEHNKAGASPSPWPPTCWPGYGSSPWTTTPSCPGPNPKPSARRSRTFPPGW